jgi:hypothetical protein
LAPAGYNRRVTETTFHLYWLRETGCDAGTPLAPGELPAGIRDRALALTQQGPAAAPATWHLRLPFFDRAQERQQEALLAKLPLERTGNLIRAVLEPAAATRDAAATSALTDPLWRGAPPERDPAYFPTWQRVSLALQRWLRDSAAAHYFRDPSRFEDRAAAYPMIIYQACRPFFGRPRTEFTYDLRDFPWRQDTLEASWRLTGRAIQRVLARIEQRLLALGQESLARRYSPVWHEDVLVAVRRKPKAYADLLAREAALINAVIDLGTQPRVANVNRTAKIVNLQLRRFHGEDMRVLGCGVFEEATRALARYGQGGGDNIVDAWPLEDAHAIPARRPDARICA